MSQDGLDPSMLQDFLTESGELIEQLDADLVSLENAQDGESQDLLDGIFRSIHTIKGAASFLQLSAITTFSHAAEDVLNCMRKGEIDVTTESMDILLQSTDVLREMIEELGNEQPITEAPGELFDQLHGLLGKDESSEESEDGDSIAADASDGGDSSQVSESEEANSKAIELDATKMDLLSFMVSDLQDSLKQIDGCFDQLSSEASRGDGCEHLAEIAEQIGKTADFFHLESLASLAKTLNTVAPSIVDAPSQLIDEILIRLQAAACLIEEQTSALDRKVELVWPLDTFIERLESLAGGESLDDDITGKHDNSVPALLELDGIIESSSSDQASEQSDVVQSDVEAETQDDEDPAEEKAAAGQPASGGDTKQKSHGAAKEQTIRVEVERLEELLNLVGQLVLSKNRIAGLTRRLGSQNLPTEVIEDFTAANSDLERMTSELQIGVMRTRMQPLAKLFDRYPRVIRDMARITEKEIGIELEGKDTEVDKSVLEQLADPLVHMLRNCADHGIESPADRVAAGKPESGIVRLLAEHQGSHVRVELSDDGKGLDREVLGRKAIEKGLTTEDKLSSLSDEEVFSFIFAAGFSTAVQVSDLSGRGVGMDVVRTNINKLNGTINIYSKKGKGTTIEILIPLTVAIMPAMMVGVGTHLYAIPLACITEIVKPEECGVHTVMGQKVMRLRDSVLPLIDLRSVLDETGSEDDGKFAVMVTIGSQNAGIIVDHLIGQQEIVIKPLDDKDTTGGPFSGATIREEGDVSLILDVIQLLRQTKSASRVAA